MDLNLLKNYLSKLKILKQPLTSLVAVAFIISLSNMVAAMSFFDAGKAYVFSPVKITVTHNEEPISEAKVIRRWEWNEKKGEDYAITDGKGIVELPEIRERNISQLFPAEFVAAQQIVVVIDGKEDRIWSFSKRNPDKNSELEGIPLDLSCDLSNEEKMYRDFGPALFTKCTWSEQ